MLAAKGLLFDEQVLRTCAAYPVGSNSLLGGRSLAHERIDLVPNLESRCVLTDWVLSCVAPRPRVRASSCSRASMSGDSPVLGSTRIWLSEKSVAPSWWTHGTSFHVSCPRLSESKKNFSITWVAADRAWILLRDHHSDSGRAVQAEWPGPPALARQRGYRLKPPTGCM